MAELPAAIDESAGGAAEVVSTWGHRFGVEYLGDARAERREDK